MEIAPPLNESELQKPAKTEPLNAAAHSDNGESLQQRMGPPKMNMGPPRGRGGRGRDRSRGSMNNVSNYENSERFFNIFCIVE